MMQREFNAASLGIGRARARIDELSMLARRFVASRLRFSFLSGRTIDSNLSRPLQVRAFFFDLYPPMPMNRTACKENIVIDNNNIYVIMIWKKIYCSIACFVAKRFGDFDTSSAREMSSYQVHKLISCFP